MDQNLDKDIQEKQLEDTSDEKTIRQRQKARKKLESIVPPEEDIEDILQSLEQYCIIIIESM